MSSTGPSSLAQSDKMGTYHLFGYVNQRPAYQHESGLDYLYYAEGDAWVIGATFGGSRVGVVNFDKRTCPYVITDVWRHSVGGKLEKDPGILLTCTDPRPVLPQPAPAVPLEHLDLISAPSLNSVTLNNKLDEASDRIDIVTPETTTTTAQVQTIKITTPLPEVNITFLQSTVCDCPVIEVTSRNVATVEKHGAQLGRYQLVRVQAGRPIYQHIDSQAQYLYYHPYSGGNWLINTEVGLLYGGIQNSKDVPVCPYLINTMWQYGDSDLGGWVYDGSLKVTCPTDPCSVLQCGFRAQCVSDPNPRCVCRDGFQGDPSLRCYPKDIPHNCPCKNVLLSSPGKFKKIYFWLE
jgi:hypothetical protein